MPSIDLILLTLVLVVYFLGSFLLYAYLEKKDVFPVVYDVYTGKKKLSIYFEFSRTFFFLLIAFFFLIKWKIALFFILLVFSLVQFIILKGKIAEVNKMQEAHILEWTNDNANGEEDETVKVVLTNEYIYFGKHDWLDIFRLSTKRRIPIYNKMYSYIILSDIYRKNNLLVIKFGFLGTPLAKRVMEIPAGMEKKVDDMIRKVQHNRKGSNDKKMDFELERRLFRLFFKK